MPYLMGKTKKNQLEALDHLMDYLKERSDFAKTEEDHIGACKAICRLDEVRKQLNALPAETPEQLLEKAEALLEHSK